MLKYGFNDDKPTVVRMSITYTQSPDCCQDEETDEQYLKLETEDGGGGPFIRMTIPDNKVWSVSDVHDLEEIFDDFYSRLNYKEPDYEIKTHSNQVCCQNCKYYNPAGSCKFIDAMPNNIKKCFVHINTTLND